MNYSTDKYLELGNFAKNYDHSLFFESVKAKFSYLFSKDEMDDLGVKLQVTVKKSRPMYLHGYVISSALHERIRRDDNIESITVLETGTARGFSAVVMAKVLENNSRFGKILSVDFTPHTTPEYDNCLKSSELGRKISRAECLKEWAGLVEKYIIFLTGDSRKILRELDVERVHFAFLDGAHYYEDVKSELSYVSHRQSSGDVIVCDDYTTTQYPGICKAIDEFIALGEYDHTIFYGDDGTKKRGYVYLVKK